MMEMKYTYREVIDFWQKQKLETEEDYMRMLENFSVRFAYHSGVIENEKITFHDTREIFEHGRIVDYTGDLKTLYEINNQKNCYAYLISQIVNKTSLNEICIRKIHKLLTNGTYDERRFITNHERPGEYKKHDYVTGLLEVGSSAEKVVEEMKELIEELNSADYSDLDSVITTAVYAHNVLEQIHPFTDGNGRVGRTLANYILMLHNLPPVIIFDEDKNFYYEVLSHFDLNEDIKPSIKFFEYEMEKTWNKTVAMDRGCKGITYRTLKDYME